MFNYRLFTSYFANYRNFTKGLRLISIAKYPPRGFNGEVLPAQFSMVAPSAQLLLGYKQGSINKDEYVGIYSGQLQSLDVQQFIRYYNGAIFLCYEKRGDFCHRHIFAQFIQSTTDIIVPELNLKV